METTSKLQDLYPKGPCNRTDPIVRHDSKYEASAIVTLYKPQRGEDDEVASPDGIPYDATKNDGIYYPLIRINNHILTQDQIVSFTLYHDRFMPYLDLVFDDTNDTIHFSDMPGLDNTITVVMLENCPDIHKPIKLDFYVTDCSLGENGRFYVQAEFKLLSLEQRIFKQEKMPNCTAEYCQLSENDHPTTYEFLHIIADACGLGFAASQKCRSIADDRYRLMKSETYKAAAQEHTRLGGLDEESIFDSWIDPWGMLTMVNLPWILNEPVNPDELGIQIITGIPSTDASADNMKTAPGWVHRTLTNVSENQGVHNMLVDSIEKLVDLKRGFYEGTMTEYQIVTPEGAGESELTSFSAFQIQEKEASVSGLKNAENYIFEKTKFLGFEMAELTPTLKQSVLHDEYFKQMRAHRYCVSLNQPNHGLERGCLVNLVWWLSDPTQKAIAIQNANNLNMNGEGGTPNKSGEVNGAQTEQYEYVLDSTISGTYYIDGIKWTYDNITEKLVQHLYLIKKGTVTQYYDNTKMTNVG